MTFRGAYFVWSWERTGEGIQDQIPNLIAVCFQPPGLYKIPRDSSEPWTLGMVVVQHRQLVLTNRLPHTPRGGFQARAPIICPPQYIVFLFLKASEKGPPNFREHPCFKLQQPGLLCILSARDFFALTTTRSRSAMTCTSTLLLR